MDEDTFRVTYKDSFQTGPIPVLSTLRKTDEGLASTVCFHFDVFDPSAHVLSYQEWSLGFTTLSPSASAPTLLCACSLHSKGFQ